ncbi:protein transporter [Pholiota conissans]|uniref:Mitochondrial import inner membrane translocase subunit TIM16 n=1 Tax=Pholiota conissans TaxID=109636 RepID=A0A9P5Z1P1_9AGAR|nr:protein transporter [Pholiota conissans]
MASPKAVVQILLTGTKILGKAFYEAGRQAVKNAKSSPAAMGGDVAGVGHATSGSPTDQLTRLHRMTVDEAQLILNVKRESPMEQILKNYEHLFKVNSPPPPPAKPATGKQTPSYHSHYLQSKVWRARERLEAEFKIGEAPAETPATKPGAPPSGTPPVDPPQSGTP